MDIYTFMNLKYKEQQRTGKSSIKFPIFNVKNTAKQSEVQSNNIHKYKCGHISKSIIINTNSETLSLYTEWMYNNPCDFCLDCWLKNKEQTKGDINGKQNTT